MSKGARRKRGRGGDKLIAKHCEICETEFTCTGDSLALLQLISKVSASCTGRRCTPSPSSSPSSSHSPSRHCVCLSIAVSGYCCCCCVCVNHHPIRVITESALQSALPQLPHHFPLPSPTSVAAQFADFFVSAASNGIRNIKKTF